MLLENLKKFKNKKLRVMREGGKMLLLVYNSGLSHLFKIWRVLFNLLKQRCKKKFK